MAASQTGAVLDVDFLVVGGGIAGLSVAFILAEAGHRVRLVEKRGLGVPAGGLRVPPNLSKILAQWVGPEELARTAVHCVGTPLRHRECPLIDLQVPASSLQLPTVIVGSRLTGGKYVSVDHRSRSAGISARATHVGTPEGCTRTETSRGRLENHIDGLSVVPFC